MRWLPVLVIVLSTSAADLLKSRGMRDHGELDDFRLGALGRALVNISQNRFVIAAVLADIVSFVAFVVLLSMAELSFAVPATAAIFVVETICARLLLKEQVSWQRWFGVFFIVCGIGFLER